MRRCPVWNSGSGLPRGAVVSWLLAAVACTVVPSSVRAQGLLKHVVSSVGLAQLRPDSCKLSDDLRAPTPPSRQLVTVSYRVDKDGQLIEAQVTGQSGDAEYDARLTQRLRECRFVPGQSPDAQGRTGGVLFMALGPWPAAGQRRTGPNEMPGPIGACTNDVSDYPIASLRSNEQGRLAMRAWVQADGRLHVVELLGSTGHPRLDQASLLALTRCRLGAGTDDAGQPRAGWFDVAFEWRLQ